MFETIKNPVFRTTVTLRVPDEDGVREVKFTARFKGLSMSEAEAFDITTADGLRAYIRAILIGWGDLAPEGKDIAFSPKALAELLDAPIAPTAILRAYNAGLLDAKLGN